MSGHVRILRSRHGFVRHVPYKDGSKGSVLRSYSGGILLYRTRVMIDFLKIDTQMVRAACEQLKRRECAFRSVVLGDWFAKACYVQPVVVE